MMFIEAQVPQHKCWYQNPSRKETQQKPKKNRKRTREEQKGFGKRKLRRKGHQRLQNKTNIAVRQTKRAKYSHIHI